jgi:hypothetical protein
LCIVQDDERDWAREAARMATIYPNASLSIAANRAEHSDEDSLQAREREPWDHVAFEDEDGAFDLYFRQHMGKSEVSSKDEWRLDVS